MSMGVLYIVATPVGHTDDITLRALKVLADVDAVLAEDTRTSRKLLEVHGITTPLQALHEHNERSQTEYIAGRLRNGESLALISDAGTPLISDPGYVLVSVLAEQGFTIVPVPGACAAISAMSAAGLPTDRFLFEGFLPAKAAARRQRLQSLCTQEPTLIFYEAPHRILSTLEDLAGCFGDDRNVVMAREMTKTFETFLRGTAAEVLARVREDSNQQRGEIVLLVEGCGKTRKGDALEDYDRLLLTELLTELPLKKASVVASRISGKARKQFYEFGLSLKEQ